MGTRPLHLQPILVYLYLKTSLLLISRQICPSISNHKSAKSYSKKPTLPHPDYVDNCYWNYSDLDEGDDRKPSPVDSSPDYFAATSEAARIRKFGLQTQLAMRPKKKRKVWDHHHPRRITTINHHYASPLSPQH